MMLILAAGPLTTIQDLGRPGHRALGVGLAGAMDRTALILGNILLGNPHDAAGVEIAVTAFKVRFDADTPFAITDGDCAAQLNGSPVPPWWTMMARKGQILDMRPPRNGMFAYLTVAGGVEVSSVLDSRSTDLKGEFGGFEGRALVRDDLLHTGTSQLEAPMGQNGRGFGFAPSFVAQRDAPIGASCSEQTTAVRVLPAAEFEMFPAEVQNVLWTTDYSLQRDSNRVGYRLAGPSLGVGTSTELFSHGILPGVIQIPPSGQPVVQMVDANTCGGYPKIAVVIGADLGRLAQIQPGGAVRFVRASHDEAIATRQVGKAYLARAERYATLAGLARIGS
jgi:5-oxoprolinase (ATP-hydrolysing) subunit C